ncbi:MAG: hypothetical protein V1876_03035 [Candidatus Peregrinibacteria bacterium]
MQNVPLKHLEHGILERRDPDTGAVTVIFEECLILRSEIGKTMHVCGNERHCHTSPVVSRNETPKGFEVHTKTGSVYRFTRTPPPIVQPADPPQEGKPD